MPEESATPDLVELTRRINETANRRDFDLLMSVYAPDAVVDAEGLGTFEGRAAIRRFFEDMVHSFGEYLAEQEEFLDLGNGVGLGVVRQSGRPGGSVGRVQQRYAVVTEWAEGLIVRATFRSDIDEGRAAAERLAEERSRAMSHGNVEIVRRGMEAAFRKPKPDWPTLSEVYHPDHEFISIYESLEGGSRIGARGYRDWLVNREETVQAQNRLEQVTEIDEDRVLAIMPTSIRGKSSAVALDERRLACVVTVRDGKIVRTEVYPSSEEALEALGLGE